MFCLDAYLCSQHLGVCAATVPGGDFWRERLRRVGDEGGWEGTVLRGAWDTNTVSASLEAARGDWYSLYHMSTSPQPPSHTHKAHTEATQSHTGKDYNDIQDVAT